MEHTYIKRKIDINVLLRKKSHFLFGPRQTGKSTLCEMELEGACYIDLLDDEVLFRLRKSPKELSSYIQKDSEVVIIDEVQALPALLNEVQRLMKKRKWTFLLTGSSARKLKKKGVNLLGGRAWVARLYSLRFIEIPDFDLITYLNRGGLPHIYYSDYYQEELKSYIMTYLKVEVQAESLVRNLQPFSIFLDVLGKQNTEEINYTSLARDAGVSDVTIRSYIEILEDTLLGFCLPAFTKSKKRRPMTRKKFYFFDVGVANYLAGERQLNPKSKYFGSVFEHFIVSEVLSYLEYSCQNEVKLSYWRSTSGFEVDLIIGDSLAIEIKSTSKTDRDDTKGLVAFKEEEFPTYQYIIVSQDTLERTDPNQIEHRFWKNFLLDLWQDKWKF